MISLLPGRISFTSFREARTRLALRRRLPFGASASMDPRLREGRRASRETGQAECLAGEVMMMRREEPARAETVGADKANDTVVFVRICKAFGIEAVWAGGSHRSRRRFSRKPGECYLALFRNRPQAGGDPVLAGPSDMTG